VRDFFGLLNNLFLGTLYPGIVLLGNPSLRNLCLNTLLLSMLLLRDAFLSILLTNHFFPHLFNSSNSL
jgi:hypothetical protein